MAHPRSLPLLLALAALALPGTAQAGWSKPRLAGTVDGETVHTHIAFSKRGDALLIAVADDRGFSSLRPRGGDFGARRRLKAPPSDVSPGSSVHAAVLDADRGATLLWQTHVDGRRFFADHIWDCCTRLRIGPLSARGRAGPWAELAEPGYHVWPTSVADDGTGDAVIVWRGEQGYRVVVRRRGGELRDAGPLPMPPSFDPPPHQTHGYVHMDLDGDAVAVGHPMSQREVRYVLRPAGGEWGRPRTLFATERFVYGFILATGRAGHQWAVWREAGAPGNERTPNLWTARRLADGSFEAPRQIAGGKAQPVVAVDEAGRLVLAWSDQGGMHLTASDAGGRLPPAAIVGPPAAAPPGLQPAIVAGGSGQALLAWRDRGGRIRAVRVAGGRHGSARTLARPRRGEVVGAPVPGISRYGEALVAFVRHPELDGSAPRRVELTEYRR